jgi:hypothetical protein
MKGYLRMMPHTGVQPVQYKLHLVNYSELKKNMASGATSSYLPLNEFLGKEISLHFSGEIRCVSCGALTKKSFNGGACYKCFINLAENDLCIVKPETCHFDQGTCREPEWGLAHCFRSHIVYFANTSGLKVGITKENPYTKRWVDQGATQGLPVLEVSSRKQAGLLEVEFAKFVADKTSWQKMISSDPEKLDLLTKSKEILDKISWAGKKDYKILQADVTQINYPILEYPKKKVSLKPNFEIPLKNTLIGIKGQYLLFPSGAINLRSLEGYWMEFSV